MTTEQLLRVLHLLTDEEKLRVLGAVAGAAPDELEYAIGCLGLARCRELLEAAGL